MIVQLIGLIVAFDGGGRTQVPIEGFGAWNDTFAVTAPQMTTSTWVGLAIAGIANLCGFVFSIWN